MPRVPGREAQREERPLSGLSYAWWVAGLTLVGGVVRFAGLGRQSFWVDETVTASLLAHSFRDMLDALPSSESTPPLYYVVAWAWTRVFGSDEAGLRSLSAFSGTLTIPVVYAAAATLATRRAGLATAALATVSPLLVWYSQEARAYAILVLFSALSFAFFARALEHPSWAVLVGWSATSVLAFFTHYFAGFLVAGEAAVLLVIARPRRQIVAAGSAIAVVSAALLPLTLKQAGGSSTWIRGVDLPLRIGDTLRQLAVPSPPTIWAGADVAERYLLWLWPLALVVVGGAVALVLAFGGSRERRGFWIALSVGTSSVLAPIALSVAAKIAADGRGDYLLYRNLIVAWLPLWVAVGIAVTVARKRALALGAAGLLLLASCAVLAGTWSNAGFQRDDWRAVAERVRGPGRVIVLSPSWEVDALYHYVPGLVSVPAGGARIDEIDVIVRLRAPSYTTLLRNYAPPPGFRLTSEERIQHWTLTRFRAPSPTLVTAAELAPDDPRRTSQIVLFESRRAQERRTTAPG